MISVLCPSRGRPALALRMFETLKANSSNMKQIDLTFYLNDDDPVLDMYKQVIPKEYLQVGPAQSTAYSWNMLAERAKHNILFLAGDDCRFNTKDWDINFVECFDQHSDKIMMAVPYDGKPKDWYKKMRKDEGKWTKVPHDYKISSPHFAVHKNWMKKLGYFVPPWFWHFYVDTYTQKVADKLGRLYLLHNTEVHASKVVDDTANRVRKVNNIHKREDYVWTKVRDRHLQADVDLLKKFINGS